MKSLGLRDTAAMHETSERVDEQPLPFSAIETVAAAPVRVFRYRDRPNDPQTYIGPVVEACAPLAERADSDNALGVDLHSLVGVLWAACNELFNNIQPLEDAAGRIPQIVSSSQAEHAGLREMVADEVGRLRSWTTGQVASETSARVAAQSAMTQAITGAMSTAMTDERALRQKGEVDEAAARSAAIDVEVAARRSADQAEITARQAGLQAETAARQSADQSEAAARAAADQAEAATRQAGAQAEATAREAADQAEAAARRGADDAEAQARMALATRVGTLETSVSTLSARLAALETRKPVLCRASGNLPLLAVNATTDIACSWSSVPTALPDLGQCAALLAPGLGSTTATIKSVSSTGVTVTVKAGVAITASTGALQVIGVSLQG